MEGLAAFLAKSDCELLPAVQWLSEPPVDADGHRVFALADGGMSTAKDRGRRTPLAASLTMPLV